MTARVLVVDDILSNVKLLEAKLTTEYFEVISAFNGEQALERVAAELPDIVLLDVMMPGMDGFEVMRELKAIETEGDLPILVLTALPQHKLPSMAAGAKDFMSKPFVQRELLDRVSGMLEARLLQRDARR